MHTKQHGKIYIVFTGVFGFYWFLSIHFRAHTIPSYDRIFWNRKDRPASEKTNISVRVVGFCKFTEEQFPPKEAFHSSLSGADISVEDYPHAQQIWEAFGIKNVGKHNDLYVLTDVLSLADVFENFREIGLKYYGLDAAHTSPGLAWQAALKMTGVRLELLTNIDMHLFLEKSTTRGYIHDSTEASQSQQHICTRIWF
jgi:hypothetical protein